MIHWAWLIPTFILGGFIGVALMCLMFISRAADDKIEKIERGTKDDVCPQCSSIDTDWIEYPTTAFGTLDGRCACAGCGAVFRTVYDFNRNFVLKEGTQDAKR